MKDGFGDILKEKGLDIDSLRLHLSATGRCYLNSTQEKDWRKWNVWKYAKGMGDGSFRDPYVVFMSAAGNMDPGVGKIYFDSDSIQTNW